jgi:hypothetical protein
MERNQETEVPTRASSLRKNLKIVLITLSVVLAAFFTMYVLTEDVSIAPFVYAIF